MGGGGNFSASSCGGVCSLSPAGSAVDAACSEAGPGAGPGRSSVRNWPAQARPRRPGRGPGGTMFKASALSMQRAKHCARSRCAWRCQQHLGVAYVAMGTHIWACCMDRTDCPQWPSSPSRIWAAWQSQRASQSAGILKDVSRRMPSMSMRWVSSWRAQAANVPDGLWPAPWNQTLTTISAREAQRKAALAYCRKCQFGHLAQARRHPHNTSRKPRHGRNRWSSTAARTGPGQGLMGCRPARAEAQENHQHCVCVHLV